MHDLVTWSCLSGNDAPFVSTFPARQPAPSLSALGIMPVSSYQRQFQAYIRNKQQNMLLLFTRVWNTSSYAVVVEDSLEVDDL